MLTLLLFIACISTLYFAFAFLYQKSLERNFDLKTSLEELENENIHLVKFANTMKQQIAAQRLTIASMQRGWQRTAGLDLCQSRPLATLTGDLSLIETKPAVAVPMRR